IRFAHKYRGTRLDYDSSASLQGRLRSLRRSSPIDRGKDATNPKLSLRVWHFARSMGLEPTISAVTGRRFNQLSYDRISYCYGRHHTKKQVFCRWCRREELNLRPWAYESHALTN